MKAQEFLFLAQEGSERFVSQKEDKILKNIFHKDYSSGRVDHSWYIDQRPEKRKQVDVTAVSHAQEPGFHGPVRLTTGEAYAH